jgi:uncharacterized surface protein with fasciclin (FAS1) repeats
MLIVALVMVPFTALAAEQNIVEIAVENESFTTLVAAVQAAGLVDTLVGEGPFTVFAPTDEAFANLLAELNISAADLLAHPQLTDVLLYHVVAGNVMSTDLSQGMQAPTVNGEQVTVSLEGGVFINSSKVVLADIEATNGVIHVIDTVLVPSGFTLSAEEVPVANPATSDTSILLYVILAIIAALGLFIFMRRSSAVINS